MSQTVTMLTDYALAAVTAVLGAVLLVRAHGAVPEQLWGWAFRALAAAGVLGGTYHGFHDSIAADTLAWLWRFNVWSIGLFGLGAVAATAIAAFAGGARRAVLAAAVAGYAMYAVLTYGDDRFVLVLAESAVVMVVVLAIHLAALRHNPATPWIVAGIAVSAVAAVAQASDIAVGPLNHNDIYHLVQLAAMILLFRGARRLGPARV